MTAHNWRALRQRGLNNGIGDLMALASMHVVLDMAEGLCEESVMHGAQSETEARAALSGFHDKLYRPDLREALKINAPDEVPPGFEADEVEATFDAFLTSVNGT